MDIYHIWCNLKTDVRDTDFTTAAQQYLDHLKTINALSNYRITRRKLGLGSRQLGEFHLMLEFNNLAQLDTAFSHAASRNDPVESFHFAMNSKVTDLDFALYRDFPDSIRQTGKEKF